MKLTSRFHYRFVGLWVLVTSVLVGMVNGLLFLLAEERFGHGYSSESTLVQLYIDNRFAVGGMLLISTALFLVGIALLAKFTSHRVAGPYIRLKNVFKAVRDGNMEQRLKFRDYDQLEDLEAAFDEMMDAVREKIGKG